MSVGTTKSERRRKSRKRPLTLVYVELASANGGMMRDLSEEGFAVRAMMPVRAGESTPFAFSLSDKVRIEGRGQIHWVQENGHVAGVRFLDLTADTREQIREWLLRPEMPPKREQSATPKEVTLEELREEIHSVPPRPELKPSEEARRTSPVPAEPAVAEAVASAKPAEGPTSAPAREATPIEVTATPSVREAETVRAQEPEAVAASEPQPVAIAPAEEPVPEPLTPVITKVPEPAAPPMVAKEPEPPVAIASPPVAVEGSLAASRVVEGTPSAPDSVPAAPVPATPVASAAPVVPPEKAVEPLVVPEAKREKIFEEPTAPALPRLTLFPRVVDPGVQPTPSGLTASEETSPPTPHWKPIPLTETPHESEAKPPEMQPALPDISLILMQPPGKAHAQRPSAPIPPMETLPSWDPESVRGESWSERFSLANAIVLMSIVALLASLYVFHREVGQGFIWLGEQLGGVPESSSPAAIPANNSTPRTLEQPATTQPDTSAQSEQTLQPTNTAASEQSPEAQDSAVKSAAPPVAPLSGVAPPISSNPDTGQNEYAQAMQLRRSKNAAAAMPETLRLLWISVEKGNATAELELAQMYWRGQGVIQNCDQAHILLTAAARKGSAEAQRRLVEFQKAGCE